MAREESSDLKRSADAAFGTDADSKSRRRRRRKAKTRPNEVEQKASKDSELIAVSPRATKKEQATLDSAEESGHYVFQHIVSRESQKTPNELSLKHSSPPASRKAAQRKSQRKPPWTLSRAEGGTFTSNDALFLPGEQSVHLLFGG